jgi:hypothetical protein
MSEQSDRYLLEPKSALVRLGMLALVIGVASLGGCVYLALTETDLVAQSYLAAFLFWSGLALGSLVILMLQHITGGAWGAMIRRILESASRTLPLLFVLFLPIVFLAGSLYEWSHANAVANDEILRHKSSYLNLPFFTVRALVYFAVWVTLAHFLSRWSREQDRGVLNVQRLENISRGGLLLFAMTMTFASIDWAMSLEPHWYSTIYGILFIGGQVLSAMAFAILVAAAVASQEPVGAVMTPSRFQDLGKLLLAFVMLWAYFSFSQFLIIWSGDLPEETPWYLRRIESGWLWVAVALVVFHFVLPFVLLLSRSLKRSRVWLMLVALVLLVMRAVDVSWLVVPAFERHGAALLPSDLLAFTGIGGLWFFFFVRQLRGAPLVPFNDESLPELHGVEA